MVEETVPKDILDILSSANFPKAASMSYGAISVTSAITTILVARSTRTGCIIVNNSDVTVYLGGDAVTTANGLPLISGASYSNQDWVGAIYGIVSEGTANVRMEDFY